MPFACATIVALLRFTEPQLHMQVDGSSLRHQVSLTWNAILRNPRFLPVVALSVLTAVLLAAIFEFGPLWLVEADASPGLYGPYWAALMATLGLCGLLAGRFPFHRRAIAALVAVGAQIVLALLVLVVSLSAAQLLHDSAASTIRSRVASGVSALGWICFVPFAFIFGVIARDRGVGAAAWMLVGTTALACLTLVVVARLGAPPPGCYATSVAA